jgi:hypothetical protein
MKNHVRNAGIFEPTFTGQTWGKTGLRSLSPIVFYMSEKYSKLVDCHY